MVEQTNIKEPVIARWHPSDKLHLHLSLDDHFNLDVPIDRNHDLPGLSIKGKRLNDQHEMRRGIVKTTAEHLAGLAARHQSEEIRCFVGNGNLLANYGFVAWQAGKLYHLESEPVFKQPYSSIVGWNDGCPTVEDVWFASENGRVVVLRRVDSTVEDITNTIEFATSGQPLVRMGLPIPLEQIAEKWYDTRHLIQPLLIYLNGTALFVPNYQLQQGLLRKAICEPVHIRLEAEVDAQTTIPLSASRWLNAVKSGRNLAPAAAFLKSVGLLPTEADLNDTNTLFKLMNLTEGALEESLQRAGYHLNDIRHTLNEGEACFINGHIKIAFKKAIYPHNIFTRNADGSCAFVVFPGKSGSAGTTLQYAQQFLIEKLGAVDALLLDNGGDAQLWYRGQYLVESSEKREEIRSILALTIPKGDWAGNAISIS
jgi:Phosphodiester glycosidase